MSTWSSTYRQRIFKWHQSNEQIWVLPTRWRRKPAGIDKERNYVTVTLCITPLKCFSAAKRYRYPVDNGHDDDAAGMKTESVNGTVSDVHRQSTNWTSDKWPAERKQNHARHARVINNVTQPIAARHRTESVVRVGWHNTANSVYFVSLPVTVSSEHRCIRLLFLVYHYLYVFFFGSVRMI